MKLQELFGGLAEAIISEETMAQDGSPALQNETYTFVKASEPSLTVGNVVCVCRKGNELFNKELSALALLELLRDGEVVYQYKDMMLGMCRVLGGVAKWGENDTFTKKLTII